MKSRISTRKIPLFRKIYWILVFALVGLMAGYFTFTGKSPPLYLNLVAVYFIFTSTAFSISGYYSEFLQTVVLENSIIGLYFLIGTFLLIHLEIMPNPWGNLIYLILFLGGSVEALFYNMSFYLEYKERRKKVVKKTSR